MEADPRWIDAPDQDPDRPPEGAPGSPRKAPPRVRRTTRTWPTV